MFNQFKLSIATLAIFSATAYAEQLEQINVEASIPPKEQVFKKASAVSTRENISASTQSIDDIIRTVPGAFTNLDKSSGTVSVNVRGLTGFGRVNTMVDGVSQTFFATSGDNSEKAGGTSQFGATIDPSFITGVDIQRGGIGGRAGVNALVGSANFRTIGVDDVLIEGKNVGALLNVGGGTNATGPNYLGALAYRYPLSDTASLGFMYAYSWRKISQDFKVGGGLNIKDVDDEEVERLVDKACSGEIFCNREEARKKYGLEPYEPSKLLNYPESHLVKLEYNDEHNKAVLSYRTLATALSGRKLGNKNYQLNYQLKPKENLQLELILADNTSTQTYQKGTLFNHKELENVLETKNRSKTMDLNVHFSVPLTEKFSYEATLGGNFLENKYSKNRHPRELAYYFEGGEPNSSDGCDKVGDYKNACKYHGIRSNTFQPDGQQRFKTFYFDQTFKYDIYSLKLNVNRQMYKYSGTTFPRDPRDKFSGEYHETELETKDGLKVWVNANSEEIVNKYGVEEAIKQGCNIYRNESKGYVDIYNCPTDYSVKKGSSRSHDNYSLSFSADFHPLFSPFVSYAKTHRVPNIKEMYFSEFGTLAVNTDLKSEKAKTIQFGINGYKDRIFSEYDVLGFKILAYQTKIKDYILNVKQECSTNSYRGGDNPPTAYDCIEHISHINYNGGKTILKSGKKYTGDFWVDEHQLIPVDSSPVVKIQGLELELNYDIGWFYANLSYARQKTNQPSSFSDSSYRVNTESENGKYLQGFGLSKISVLPRDYGSLDIGTRLFDGKLTLGSIAKYYGKSKRSRLDKVDGDVILPGTFESRDGKVYLTYVRISGTEEVKAQPMIFDVYAIYQPTENLTIKGEIQNLFDKKYINPLEANNDSSSQMTYAMGVGDGYNKTLNNYAKGRTFILNVNYKF